MAKTFAEYAQERRDRMGSEGRDAERVSRAHYASLSDEGTRSAATEDNTEPQD
jgi:hypothetical protein